MTIYRTLLAKGYLPKELPPSFHSESFAQYASTQAGRAALQAYRSQHRATECVTYTLALPSSDQRILRIPHPSGFANLAAEIARSFRRLLRKAAASSFSRSRPVFATDARRAIRPRIDPANLSREKTLNRAASSYLLRADVSQFYPSLYTHAVGWAVDPALRLRANWTKPTFLGKRLDQALMDMQGKISQGVPIGNDISFLLAEIVLGQVDRDLRKYKGRAYRWFDDYEIACDSRQEAETALLELRQSLGRFNLRLNPKKIEIVELPIPSSDGWQLTLVEASRGIQLGHRNMVRFFDTVFHLRARHPDVPIFTYALGLLFRISSPTEPVLRVAESCIAQALLSEPGCAQKAFALLTFWALNGAPLARTTMTAAVEKVILRHESTGTSSDVAWALAFCIEQKLVLAKRAGKALARFDDDCVAIQSMHAHAAGSLPAGFDTRAVAAELKKAVLEERHWLALYEGVRHGYLPSLAPTVNGRPLFAEMLAKGVSFYRQAVPSYAAVVHPGGAPHWVVRAWIGGLAAGPLGAPSRPASAIAPPAGAAVDMIRGDAANLATAGVSLDTLLQRMLAKLQPAEGEVPDETADKYS
ncbi:MAG: RNA-directed DNA polymerase [Polyangiaceae bacterium]